MLDEWPLELSSRTAAVRLDGVDVFYDFDWRAVFGHNRSAFPNGQSLTCLLTRDCPEGLIPTLLLTCLPDQRQRTHTTDERFIAVVQIHEYLLLRGADPAATYFAQQSGAAVTDLTQLSGLSPDDVRVLLDRHLDVKSLEAWFDRDPRHRTNLLELLRRRPDLAETVTTDTIPLPEQIRGLAELDEHAFNAFVDQMNRMGWPEAVRAPALTAIAAAPGAALEIGRALGDNLPHRLQEIRDDAAAYRRLIEEPQVGETAVQEFIEQRPWLIGLEYHGVRGRLPVLRSETDFVLDRFDGYYDILELKAPSDSIVDEAQSGRADQPSSPSQHRLSRPLSQALAQAHLYRHILATLSPESAEMYGLPYHRHPEMTILLGRAADLSETGRHILTELNLSLGHVRIIPFDQLAQRIEGIVANLEGLLIGGGVTGE